MQDGRKDRDLPKRWKDVRNHFLLHTFPVNPAAGGASEERGRGRDVTLSHPDSDK